MDIVGDHYFTYHSCKLNNCPRGVSFCLFCFQSWPDQVVNPSECLSDPAKASVWFGKD